jgi:hypothetical protein
VRNSSTWLRQNCRRRVATRIVEWALPPARESTHSARMLDAVISIYLGLHAVTALLIDSQLVFPQFIGTKIYEQIGVHGALQQWGRDNKDHLVLENPLWFRSVVWAELIFQVPFCLVGCWAWATGQRWIRIPSIVYASHVLTTMIPIITELAVAGAPPVTLAVYGLWVLLPAIMLFRSLGKPKQD